MAKKPTNGAAPAEPKPKSKKKAKKQLSDAEAAKRSHEALKKAMGQQ